MTLRQKLLKQLYPIIRTVGKLSYKGPGVKFNTEQKEPEKSFYELSCILNNGSKFNFSALKGKKVLLVNVASDCGYTPQYEELEQLNGQLHGELVVLAFPSNDFKDQEPANDREIETFCKVNYGVSFPLFRKGAVSGTSQQNVFQWLSQVDRNGWNDQAPNWNFSKYLVDTKGRLQYFFAPHISPAGSEMMQALHSIG